jgi:transposase
VVEVMGMEQSAPRVVEADRSQLELRPFDLDSTIPQNHRARLVWRAVETLDLSGFYERIKSRVGTAGRPPGDPKVFVALWLYATMDGVGAAREVERLCRETGRWGRRGEWDNLRASRDPHAGKSEARSTRNKKTPSPVMIHLSTMLRNNVTPQIDSSHSPLRPPVHGRLVLL